MQKSEKDEARQLEHLFSITPVDPTEKIETVKQQFIDSGAADATKSEMEKYTQQAFKSLDAVKISEDKKELLRAFGNNLMKRTV